MDNDALLDLLVQRYGIQPGYHDIWGHYNRLSTTSRHRLLAALGLPVDDELALCDALDAHQQRDWLTPAPPVAVVPQHAIQIVLSLPETAIDGDLHWQLCEESGTQHHDRVPIAQLEHLAQRHINGHTYQRLRLTLPDLPCGYHKLQVAEAQTSLIVVPDRCQPLPTGRHWGLAVQLYAVRSERNWGIGDFADLQQIVTVAAAQGAVTIGLNPLHALFPDQPQRCSPYSPSNRCFINPLYLAIDSIDDFSESTEAQAILTEPAMQAELRRLRQTDWVDYAGVAAVKYSALRVLYEHFRTQHLAANSPRAAAFQAYVRDQGEPLRRQAIFETLNHWFHSLDPSVSGWHDWLRGFQHPDAETVAQQAEQQAHTVQFFQYLQWQCDLQLSQVAATAKSCGLRLGLYQDLAVGADSGGGEVWAERDCFALGARIGAPPDDFSPSGQDWGLPPWNPRALYDSAYRPYITILQAVMRHAGVLRIDHVMSLLRLFWIPPNCPATDGAYVHYPLADLMGILALESQRHRCAIIGEDLGTVPDEVRSALDATGVYSYRPLYFQKHWDADGRFQAPHEYPEQALVTATTHDLPTLAGFWAERDIDWRAKLNLFPRPEIASQQRHARAADRRELLTALQQQGLRPADMNEAAPFSPELMLAIQQFLARSPAQLLMVQLEDVLGQIEQVNIPGTVDEHPNWCRKLEVPIEAWATWPEFITLGQRLRIERSVKRA